MRSFSSDKAVAQKYQFHYQNGLQVFNLPRGEYERLVEQGAIKVDPLENASVYAPAATLDDFNRALKLGPPNRYIPE